MKQYVDTYISISLTWWNRFDDAGRDSCFKFAMREIRNYVRIGNWCDSAAIYIHIYRNIIREQTMDEFPFGRRDGLRRVHSSNEKRTTNWTGNNKKSRMKRGFCERHRSPCAK